jgi:hypothetical protein
VAGIDFYFAVHLPAPFQYEGLLNEVAGSVLRYAGCAAFNAGEVLERLDAMATSDAAADGCDVHFRAEGGVVEIVMSTADGRVLRLTCAGR